MKPQFSGVPMQVYKTLNGKKGEVPRGWGTESSSYLHVHLKNVLLVAKHFELQKREIGDFGETLTEDEVLSSSEEGIHLPFPATTLYREIGNTRVFIVAWDNALMDAVLIKAGEQPINEAQGEIYIHAFILNNSNEWYPTPATIGIPSKNFAHFKEDGSFGSEYRIAWADKNFSTSEEADLIGNYDGATVSAHCSRDIVELCTYLRRESTRIEVIGGSSVRAKLGQAKKLPKSFYEIRRVVIGDAPKIIKGEYKGGTHASPRWHERRGYWRTMKKTGKVVWVRACEVGQKSDGMVYKDYEVKLPK